MHGIRKWGDSPKTIKLKNTSGGQQKYNHLIKGKVTMDFEIIDICSKKYEASDRIFFIFFGQINTQGLLNENFSLLIYFFGSFYSDGTHFDVGHCETRLLIMMFRWL